MIPIHKAQEISSAAWVDTLRESIRSCYDLPSTETAILAIEKIGRSLDDLSGLVESRLRLLLGRMPHLKIDVPEWIKASTEQVEITRQTYLRPLLALLMERCPELKPEDIEINTEAYVSINIGIGRRVTWLVREPRLPWPGVNVRGFFSVGSGESFLYGPSLVDHTIQKLR